MRPSPKFCGPQGKKDGGGGAGKGGGSGCRANVKIFEAGIIDMLTDNSQALPKGQNALVEILSQ